MHHITFSFGLLFILAAPAWAGGFRQHPIYYHRFGAFPAQQFFYFVGQPVRVAALVEAEMRSDPDYQLFLEFKRFRREFETFHRGANEGGVERAKPQAGLRAPAVGKHCGACHGGAAPQAGLFLDGEHLLAAEQITAAQRRVLRGEMPPSGPLAPEEIGRVLQELLSLEASTP